MPFCCCLSTLPTPTPNVNHGSLHKLFPSVQHPLLLLSLSLSFWRDTSSSFFFPSSSSHPKKATLNLPAGASCYFAPPVILLHYPARSPPRPLHAEPVPVTPSMSHLPPQTSRPCVRHSRTPERDFACPLASSSSPSSLPSPPPNSSLQSRKQHDLPPCTARLASSVMTDPGVSPFSHRLPSVRMTSPSFPRLCVWSLLVLVLLVHSTQAAFVEFANCLNPSVLQSKSPQLLQFFGAPAE